MDSNSRFRPTERIGLVKAEAAVLEHLSWILREQPIVDVGIDALIEKCDSGNPSGRFVAAQVKSGAGNFTIAKERITHYVSNVHYHYWTNLNIPMILIGYVPEDDECYWSDISPKTLKQTDTQWKLVISKGSKLNRSAKVPLENILVSFNGGDPYSQILDFDYDTEFSEEYEAFSESIPCVENIKQSIVKLGSFFEKSAVNNARLLSQGYDQSAPQVKGSVKQQSKRIVSDTRRLRNEIRIFARSFPEEFYVVEKLLYAQITKGNALPKQLKDQINIMPNKISNAVSGIQTMRNAAKIQSKEFPVMNEAIREVGNVLDLLISEFEDAGNLVRRIRPLAEV